STRSPLFTLARSADPANARGREQRGQQDQHECRLVATGTIVDPADERDPERLQSDDHWAHSSRDGSVVPAAEYFAHDGRLQRRIPAHGVSVEYDERREDDRGHAQEQEAHTEGLKREAEQNDAALVEPVDQRTEAELPDHPDGGGSAEHPCGDP